MILTTILTILFVALATILEARQDYWICKDTKGLYKKRWKLWGNFYSGSFLAFCALGVTYTLQNQWFLSIILFVIYAIVWNIVHDCAIGYYLKKNIFYLGTTGWDAQVTKIFFNGKIWLFFKLFWLLIFIGTYFAL